MLLLIPFLLVVANFAACWTLDFAGCPLVAREQELGQDTFNLQRSGIACVNGAMRATSCGSQVNLGGPFFDRNIHNLSIEITFRASHPLPLFSPLLTIHPKDASEGGKPLVFGLYNHPPPVIENEDDDWILQLIRPHHFSLQAPAELLSSGYCDRILGESAGLLLFTMPFIDVMDAMLDPATAGDVYTAHTMLVEALETKEAYSFTSIQRGETVGHQGFFSNINIDTHSSSVFHQYRVGGSAGASYEIGCNGTGPGSAVSIMRISMSNNVYVPAFDF